MSEMIHRAKTKRLTTEDIVAISLATVALITVVALLATIKHWFFPVLAIAVIGYMVYHETKKQASSPQFPTDFVIYSLLFDVVSEIHDRINAKKPLDLDDLAVMPPIIKKNGIDMVRAKLITTHTLPNSNDDLEIVKKRLQARINARLRQGRVPFIPYISPDGRAPAIFVDAVHDNVIEYLVDVVFIDSPAKLQYYYAKHRPVPRKRPDDFDGVF